MTYITNTVGISVWILAIAFASQRSAVAQPANNVTLRAQTKVFAEGAGQQPLVETLTLFHKGSAYDIQMPGKTQITVFDIPRGQIVLLDSERKLRTTISTDQLVNFMTVVRQKAEEIGKGDSIGTGTQPSSDPATGTFRAGVPGLLYVARTTAAPSDEIARLYNDFTSWATRLNTFHSPHGAPFARLALNQSMSESGVLPSEITCRTTQDQKTSVVRSEHQFSPMLAAKDRALISEIGGMLATYKDVDTTEFRDSRTDQPE